MFLKVLDYFFTEKKNNKNFMWVMFMEFTF